MQRHKNLPTTQIKMDKCFLFHVGIFVLSKDLMSFASWVLEGKRVTTKNSGLPTHRPFSGGGYARDGVALSVLGA